MAELNRNRTGRPAIDLTGTRYTRLLVESFSHRTGVRYFWNCKCDCGNEKVVSTNHLRSGNVRSCGCLLEEANQKRTKHRLSDTPIYRIWAAMIRRCTNPNVKEFKRYGGRGICVTARWHDFRCFLEDMGPRPRGRSIERINNNGNYCKENCRWATPTEQARNTRANHIISFRGQTLCSAQWAEHLGIKQPVFNLRIRRGWDMNRIFSQPVRKSRNG